MEPHLRLGRFLPTAGIESRTARSVGQRLTYLATGVPQIRRRYKHKSQIIYSFHNENICCEPSVITFLEKSFELLSMFFFYFLQLFFYAQ